MPDYRKLYVGTKYLFEAKRLILVLELNRVYILMKRLVLPFKYYSLKIETGLKIPNLRYNTTQQLDPKLLHRAGL
jgi:hypothetical protein